MDKETKGSGDKKLLIIIIAILSATSIAYRLIQNSDFKNSSLLFVGIPAVISLLIVRYSSTPKSVIGLIFRVITLFLLMSAIVLGEGIICIVIAAPIFYLVGFIIGIVYNKFSNKNKSINSMLIVPLLFILFQPFSINTPDVEIVSTDRTYNHEVSIDMLDHNPDFSYDLPLFFRMGFPKPLASDGCGIEVGDRREIQFFSSTKGLGTLVLEIREVGEKALVFDIVSDNTHMGSWLTWKQVNVEIHQNQNNFEVTWTSYYTCDLGPQWYFNPIQERAVEIMHDHLMKSYFGR